MEKKIRSYAKLMQELGLTGLEIKEKDGTELRLERGVAAQPAASVPAAVPAAEPVSAMAGATEICSPMVGVFYTAPAENAQPFVQVGDTVRRGDVLCIIEAMKLMNEITAEYDGVITEVCAANGQVVDFGHVLFRVKRG